MFLKKKKEIREEMTFPLFCAPRGLINFFGEKFLKTWHSFTLERIHKAIGRNSGITRKDQFFEYFGEWWEMEANTCIIL